MGSQTRRLWLLAGAILGVLVAVLLGARWAVRYGLDSSRARIEHLVAQSTGRPFRLPGPLELHLAPLAVEAGPAQLGNPPGMAGPPLAEWRSMRVTFELLPLIHHRLVIDEVRLDGLRVHLQRTADGGTNWTGLLATGGQTAPARGTSSLPIELHALEIRGGELEFIDGATSPRVRLTDLRMDAGPARFGADLDIGAVRLQGKVWTPVLPAGAPIQLEVSRANLSQTPFRAAVSNASLRIAGALAQCSLSATDADRGWRARGSLSARVPSVRALAEMLGVPLPRTRDPKTLATLALTSDWTFAGEVLDVEAFNAHLDETTVTGRIVYQRKTGVPLLEIDLHGDRVDLDRYSTAAPTGSASGSANEAAHDSGQTGSILATLRAAPISGTVRFDQARVGGTDIHQVRIEMQP